MIEETNYAYGQLSDQEPTVSVPVEVYERRALASSVAHTFCEVIADEWNKASKNGYGGPSEALKTLLRLYDPELYASCDSLEEKCQKEAEKRFREKLEAEPVTPGPIYPYNPYSGGPGVAGNEIKITCEDTSGAGK